MTINSTPTTTTAPHEVLDFLARLRRVRDTQIADLLEVHRNSIPNKKRSGPLSPIEIKLLAEAFDVPLEIFDLDGLRAVQWATENRPDWFSPAEPPPSNLTIERERKLAAKLQADSSAIQWNYSGNQLRAA